MAIPNPILGTLCINNEQLVREGYIYDTISQELSPTQNNLNKLQTTPPKGTSYHAVRDDDEDLNRITKIIKRVKLLPADYLKFEINFSKMMTSSITHPISPGQLYAGFVSSTVSFFFSGLGQGGITEGINNITFHVCDSETVFNRRIEITKEILETDIITFEGEYPISVFGVVKEYISEDIGDMNDPETKALYMDIHPTAIIEKIADSRFDAKFGLDFTQDQIDNIGKYNAGQYEGGNIIKINGATGWQGQFGWMGTPYVDIEDVLYEDQQNLFDGILYDYRKLWFRGDNPEAGGRRYRPFESSSQDDATNLSILINTEGLIEKDIIYITFCPVSKRYLRQGIRHRGVVAQGPTFAFNIGWSMEINSQWDVFDYQIRSWLIPREPQETVYTLNTSDGRTLVNSVFIFTIDGYLSVKRLLASEEYQELEDEEKEEQRTWDMLEGWRLSEVVSEEVQRFWAADYRGILLVEKSRIGLDFNAEIIFPYEQIRDKEWFDSYVNGLDFVIKHTDANGNIIIDNYEIKIEDVINRTNIESPLFDICEHSNSLLRDAWKIPYYRPFAIALSEVSKYAIDRPDVLDSTILGVGICSLDIILDYLINRGDLNNVIPGFRGREFIDNYYFLETAGFIDIFNSAADELRRYLTDIDLSFSDFQPSIARPDHRYSCDDPYSILNANYFCHIYNPTEISGGYQTDAIDQSLFGWVADGGKIESYWKFETPWYCGDFNTRTRFYTEHFGGNVANFFSMVFVQTHPVYPHSISSDTDNIINQSFLVFRESNVYSALSYHNFDEEFFGETLKSLRINPDLSPTIVDSDYRDNGFDHDKYKIMGYNGIIGDKPSYNFGSPLTYEISAYCLQRLDWFFHDFEFLDSGLNFNDDIPRVDLPEDFDPTFNWRLKEITLKYKYKDTEIRLPADKDNLISLYFEDTNSSLTTTTIPVFFKNVEKYTIPCSYYKGFPLQILGDVWDYIDVISMKGRVAETDVIDAFTIDSGQSAVSYDRRGNVLVFYADGETNSISVALTPNLGEKWYKYNNTLRLVEGENASLPFIIPQEDRVSVHLFYVLNGAYLMYKEMNVDFFDLSNVWTEYIPPSSYDETSDDDIESGYQVNSVSSLHGFTFAGKYLLRQTSFFVAGDADSEYFKKEMETVVKIKERNKQIEVTQWQSDVPKRGNIIQNIRFDFRGDPQYMDRPFGGNSYAVYIDPSGIMRLFMTDKGKLLIKSSGDFRNWVYDVKDVYIHKNYIDDELNTGKDIEIKNIQLVRNHYDTHTIPILYFNRDMLFIRSFQSSLLLQFDEAEDSYVERFNITKRTGNKPIFIVGNIPEEMREQRKFELEQISAGERDLNDSELGFVIPYLSSSADIKKATTSGNYGLIDKFNEDFSLDTDTQVCAYSTGRGLIRIFYQDNLGVLRAVDLNAESFPVPEILLEPIPIEQESN